MRDVSYGFGRALEGTMVEVRLRVIEALGAEGFGILSEIDMAGTLAKKLGRAMPETLILGACNPVLASAALDEEPQISLLLPCNVVLTAMNDDQVYVSVVDPAAMLDVAANAGLASIAAEAEARLRRALGAA